MFNVGLKETQVKRARQLTFASSWENCLVVGKAQALIVSHSIDLK